MIMCRLLRKVLPFYLTTACFCLTEYAEATVASVKAMGMGECAVAFPQDALSTAWNPACAVYVGNRFDANTGWLETRGEATLHNNSFSPSSTSRYKSNVHPNSFDAEFGANYIVCGSCDVAVGFIGYNKTYFHTHYSSNIPFLGTSEPGAELIQEVLSPLLAVRLDCHCFGIAVQFAGERFKANGLENLASKLLSIKPFAMTNKGHDYAYGVGFVLGWLWNAYPGVRMGFVYESEINMGHLKHYRGLLFNCGELELPERFAAGFGFDFTCYFHGAIDLQFIRWSRTSLGRFTSPNPPISSENCRNKMGSRCGPGFAWKDQPCVKIGVAYNIPCLNAILRAGYRWARTPIRSGDTAANILTLETVESLITVGASVSPWRQHEFSFAYAYGFNHTVRGSEHKPLGTQFGGGIADLKNGLQLAKIGYGVCF